VRTGELIEVLPDHGVEGVEVYLVYLSRRQLPRAVSVFIEFMVAKMVGEGLVVPPARRRAAGSQ
jgi:DNA-binding transcriptional LysR family regulator